MYIYNFRSVSGSARVGYDVAFVYCTFYLCPSLVLLVFSRFFIMFRCLVFPPRTGHLFSFFLFFFLKKKKKITIFFFFLKFNKVKASCLRKQKRPRSGQSLLIFSVFSFQLQQLDWANR